MARGSSSISGSGSSDWDLLERYVTDRSEAAFEQLVARHVGLVYSACRRRLRDAHLAEDASQAVFVILARKARSIGRAAPLAGWLYNTSRYVSANLSRREQARRRHEAAAIAAAAAEPPSAGGPVDLEIDDALARLGVRDRNALLLRFIEGRSLREVGEALAITEEAAKKRVSRGLSRLRRHFAGRPGPALSVAVLSDSLTRSSSAALVPPGLVTSTVQAVARTAGPAADLASKVIKMLFYKKIVTTAVIGCVTVTVLGGTALIVRAQLQSGRHAGAAQTGNAPAGAVSPAPLTNASARPLEAQLHRLLPQLRFDATGLADTLQFLTDVSGVRLSADWDAIRKAGISVNAPVQLQLDHMTLTQALRSVLWNAADPGKLDYVFDEGGITVSSADALNLRARGAEPQENDAVKKLLDKPIPAARLDAQPMSKLPAVLRQAAGVPVWIDWAALQGAGVDRASTVKVSDAGSTGDAAASKQLQAVLASANATRPISFGIIDGLVVVSTADDLKKLQQLAHVSHVREQKA